MVSQVILDLSTIDLTKVVVSKEEILSLNAQRDEFEQLDKLVYLDTEEACAVGVKHQKPTEFWTRGHIPGRPLMPGVLMIEMAAQLSSVIFHKKLNTEGKVFFGFGGVNNVKFRGSVEPGSDYYMVAKAVKFRPRIATFECQGFVNDKMVFEGEITGLVL
jgi:3-hydroxyacyl-[acyl-carrier-protein] dehydratase